MESRSYGQKLPPDQDENHLRQHLLEAVSEPLCVAEQGPRCPPDQWSWKTYPSSSPLCEFHPHCQNHQGCPQSDQRSLPRRKRWSFVRFQAMDLYQCSLQISFLNVMRQEIRQWVTEQTGRREVLGHNRGEHLPESSSPRQWLQPFSLGIIDQPGQGEGRDSLLGRVTLASDPNTPKDEQSTNSASSLWQTAVHCTRSINW